jgi:hypothetical protein
VIRLEAGMPTMRFTRLIGVPERSYRRWQQRQRQGRPAEGPRPAPQRDRVKPAVIAYADRLPAWGHRKVAMLVRVDGHDAPDSTVVRTRGGCSRSTAGPDAKNSPMRAGSRWWSALGAELGPAARLQRVRIDVHLTVINGRAKILNATEPGTPPLP